VDNAIQKAISYLGPEFNDFLYAPVGVEENGMQLSVLSALARQNVDPWQEAAQLTRLSEKTAIQRLMSLIPLLSDGSSVNQDSDIVAIRLVALLPHHAPSRIPSRKMLADADAIKGFSGVILYVVFVLFSLGTQWITVNHQPLADDTHGANLQSNPPTNTFVNPNLATIKQAETSAEALNSPGVINAR
jgi:hypothetical protein